WARLSRALDQDRPTEQPQTGNGASQKLVFWRYAAAAMFAVAAVQTAVLVTPSDGPEDTYQLASESRDALQTRVMFATDATSDDITALLVETHARIVDGPSAVGFFTIEFASEQDLHTGLDVFEANAHLVMTVQSN
ncbi:MAG: hypothetical protein AAFQ67_09080, partial [Pseudomonadota bacterium]